MGLTITTNVPGFCPRCGRPIVSGAAVCACGLNLEAMPSASPSAPGATTLQAGARFVPQVTFLLIGLNTVVFLLMTLAGGSTHIQTLLDFGAMYAPFVRHGEYWRLITPIFIHIGLLHLLFNMYALFFLGNIIERLYGPTRYIYLYLLSGIGGTLTSFSFSKAVSAGASGAIFGLSGMALVVGFRYRARLTASFKRMVIQGIVPFVAFNLIYGATNKGIDNFAHVGGLLTGALASWLVRPLTPEEALRPRRFPPVGVWVAVLAVVVAFLFPLRARFAMKQVEAAFAQGLRFEKQNRLDDAAAAYQRALNMSPDLPAIHNNLAVVYSRQRKFPEAEHEAREAVRLGGEEAMYHQTLGAVLWQENKLDEAATEYSRAIQLDPKDASYHEALAGLYEQQGRRAQAIEELRAAKRLKPKDASLDREIQRPRQRP